MSYAVASVIERSRDAIADLLRRLVKRLRIRITSPKLSMKVPEVDIAQKAVVTVEDAVINVFRALGRSIQMLQCSLEDSLSALSLILELLSTLSLILLLVTIR